MQVLQGHQNRQPKWCNVLLCNTTLSHQRRPWMLGRGWNQLGGCRYFDQANTSITYHFPRETKCKSKTILARIFLALFVLLCDLDGRLGTLHYGRTSCPSQTNFTVQDNRKSETNLWLELQPTWHFWPHTPSKPDGWGTASTSKTTCIDTTHWGGSEKLLPCVWLMFSAYKQVPKLPTVIWILGSRDFEAFRSVGSPSCIITCCCIDFWREASSTCSIESLEIFIFFHQDVLCTLDSSASHTQARGTFHHQPSTV